MKIVLLGPPGAGKGSLAGLLKDQFSVAHISTGDMLRDEMKTGSALGVEIKSLIEKGALVSDELVIRLVEQKVSKDPSVAKGYMLDGFPRTVAQAEALDVMLTRLGKPLDFALCMEADTNLILKRLTGRRVCKKCGAIFHLINKPSKVLGVCDECQGELCQRADDNEETIKKRMDVYYASTQPIIDYYAKQQKLKRLDGNLETVDLCEALVKIIDENKSAHSH